MKAVFVDRDNTLIEDPGYVSHPDQVRLLPGAVQFVAGLRQAGYRVIVVTNQSGLARGLFDEDALRRVHQRLRQLMGEQGACPDDIYYCPYLEGGEAVVERYRRDSDWRKPQPGMLLQAARDHGLHLAGCWMVGDSARDIQAGWAAGCRTILVAREAPLKSSGDSEDGRREGLSGRDSTGRDAPSPDAANVGSVAPDFKAANLLDALRVILTG